MNILIIEDSKNLRTALKSGLGKLGYGVDAVEDGTEGWEYARLREYDVVVLDLMLPGLDGLSVLRKLREAGKKTQVIILSAKDQVEDRVRGLREGADDYLVKPFSFDELCARIETLVRRKYDEKNPQLSLGKVVLNTALREVMTATGKRVRMSPGEYGILEKLALRRGHIVSTEQLLDAIHDSDATPGPNLVQVLVCNIRRRLAAAGVEGIIQTRRGAGYFVE